MVLEVQIIFCFLDIQLSCFWSYLSVMRESEWNTRSAAFLTGTCLFLRALLLLGRSFPPHTCHSLGVSMREWVLFVLVALFLDLCSSFFPKTSDSWKLKPSDWIAFCVLRGSPMSFQIFSSSLNSVSTSFTVFPLDVGIPCDVSSRVGPSSSLISPPHLFSSCPSPHFSYWVPWSFSRPDHCI